MDESFVKILNTQKGCSPVCPLNKAIYFDIDAVRWAIMNALTSALQDNKTLQKRRKQDIIIYSQVGMPTCARLHTGITEGTHELILCTYCTGPKGYSESLKGIKKI
jgi:hypothetical protein